MRNFPGDWVTPSALGGLAGRITSLLSKFGKLASPPEIFPGRGVANHVSVVAFATFNDEAVARAAVQKLHGLDMRPLAQRQGGLPPREADLFFAEQLETPTAAARNLARQKGAKGLAVRQAAAAFVPPLASAAGRPSQPANAGGLEENLLVRGFPASWGEQQVRRLFVLFGGVASVSFVSDAQHGRAARVRLRDTTAVARAAEQLNGVRIGDNDEMEECKVFVQLVGKRAGSRLVTVAEVEAPARDSRSMTPVELEEFERQKKLEVAATIVADMNASRQQRRMMAALLEAERRRQEPKMREAEVAAMSAADVEAVSWRRATLEAERKSREMEVVEGKAMAARDTESKRWRRQYLEAERLQREARQKKEALERRERRRMKEEERASQRVEEAERSLREEEEWRRKEEEERLRQVLEANLHAARANEVAEMLAPLSPRLVLRSSSSSEGESSHGAEKAEGSTKRSQSEGSASTRGRGKRARGEGGRSASSSNDPASGAEACSDRSAKIPSGSERCSSDRSESRASGGEGESGSRKRSCSEHSGSERSASGKRPSSSKRSGSKRSSSGSSHDDESRRKRSRKARRRRSKKERKGKGDGGKKSHKSKGKKHKRGKKKKKRRASSDSES